MPLKLLDTDFLIDLQREWSAGELGAAHRFLGSLQTDTLVISVVNALEFLEGYQDPDQARVFLLPYRQLPVTAQVARLGSRIRRTLRATGSPIGDFDVLIAATALDAGAEIITANQRHFGRVEGLSVRGHR